MTHNRITLEPDTTTRAQHAHGLALWADTHMDDFIAHAPEKPAPKKAADSDGSPFFVVCVIVAALLVPLALYALKVAGVL